ncbi:HIT family protein [Helicobacter cappadocius]|uniref:HIT domain-containing protein n=1 Tax=Helicobacter cappadocius TaxID=3063998 RepID=A0AA90PS09_9HELI|nr:MULTISPECIES: HIT domain-containing protein [unclassified Helicobacter]MDO7252542.1 HIT domain-containing protein [Helicobacter sp. faydin-H75]MDP2538409.1 HIT domain-containing protein [Helicobacter sp. faydin-H76]
MDRIYSPWRSEYFGSKDNSCVFCDISKHPELDIENRVFYRDEILFGVMNRYPYTPGHFMLIPHFHTDSPDILSQKDWLHIHKLSQKAVSLLYDYGASGINIGMNIKKAGGAGIPEHIHLHILPRYIGDTNFFTTIAEGRTYGVDFDIVYEKIKKLAQKYFKE